MSHIQHARSAIQSLSRLGGMTQALACLAEADEYERRHWEAAGDKPVLTPNGISVAFVREVAAEYSEWISMLDSASVHLDQIALAASAALGTSSWRGDVRLAIDDLRRAAHPVILGQTARGLVREPRPDVADELRARLRPVDRIRERLLAVEDIIDGDGCTVLGDVVRAGQGAGSRVGMPEKPKRLKRRTAAEKMELEGALAAYLLDHLDATREEAANAMDCSTGTISGSKAWQTHSAGRREARRKARARAAGVDMSQFPAH